MLPYKIYPNNMVIPIPNQKGGVKKTTTVVHTGYANAEFLDRKTLLIDLDPQKNTSSIFLDNYLQLPKEDTVYAAFYDRDLPIYSTRVSNLSVVPSHLKMAGIEGDLKGAIGAERILQRALEKVKDQYDDIFIDCPPALGFILINALTAADGIVIPVSHAGFEVEGLADLIETVKKVRINYNPQLKILGLLQTMVDSTNLCTTFRKDLTDHYKDLVFDTSISRSHAMMEAISEKTTVFEYKTNLKSKERISSEYVNFARELLKRNTPIKSKLNTQL
jgi:chromosome partitioning protein